jgi:hypothetical protein
MFAELNRAPITVDCGVPHIEDGQVSPTSRPELESAGSKSSSFDHPF